ncbi:MAG: hypothetical protein ACD_44C00257G0003 [uncultured bacterium]|nr:MAG: hypothetical protein ACD_44C00257G0003 [uncultured bacterium]OGT24235.1 MAG: hypothetical protein A2W47_06675 [Gammaproteobacteria bacterium RIFCSPHIGHO2_12_38_15]OGT67542.1 MAG: hypothetical protein A3I12_06155 [Gammaproteobacteria bacterium RIFCSPLOWO2_02_FULL_38_11]OGT78084.1 MAG: hypothetical protein A3G71_05475 [Gammaproteobacteria bacterium RIFCSPLOWO2_12_FULL_38_14]
MGQLNIHMTLHFQQNLTKFMRLRHIKTKAEAIRIAVQECLMRTAQLTKPHDFSTWLGLATQVPVRRKTRFQNDNDLWK